MERRKSLCQFNVWACRGFTKSSMIPPTSATAPATRWNVGLWSRLNVEAEEVDRFASGK